MEAQKTLNSQSKTEQKEQYRCYSFQDTLQAITKTARFWHKNKLVYQWK